MDLAVNNQLNRPIRSLQTFLRAIAFENNAVPLVIPDGFFGEETRLSVEGFQRAYSLPVTGIVDNDTWDAILAEYKIINERNREPARIHIFPGATHRIEPGEESESLYSIQVLLKLLSEHFLNLTDVPIDGIHGPQTQEAVRRIQAISGLEATGVIDRDTWEAIATLYEMHISRNWVERQAGGQLLRE